MSDLIKGLVVTLKDDMRTEDVERLSGAIQMLTGVAAVDLVPKNMDDHMNRQRVRLELGQELLAVVYPEMYKTKNR